MDVKKLYADLAVLTRREVPLYDFFLYCDMGARTLLAKYPKEVVLPAGEYIKPSSLGDDFAVTTEFELPMLYFLAAKASGDDALWQAGLDCAEEIYKSLWKEKAKGKQRKGERW